MQKVILNSGDLLTMEALTGKPALERPGHVPEALSASRPSGQRRQGTSCVPFSRAFLGSTHQPDLALGEEARTRLPRWAETSLTSPKWHARDLKYP